MFKQPVTVLITCVGGRLIYDFIRALRVESEFDITVIGIDSDPQAHGRVLCDHFFVIPHAEECPEAWLEGVQNICRENEVDVLVPLSEGESRLVSEKVSIFEQLEVKTSVSSWDSVSTLTDKYLLLQCMKQNGVPIHPFHPVDSFEECWTALQALGYPDEKVVLKPRYGRGSRGVLILDACKAEFEHLLPNRLCGIGSYEAIKTLLMESNEGLDEYLALPYFEGEVHDIDCIVDQGQVLLMTGRVRQLKNPLSPSSTGHKAQLPQDIKQYVEQVCDALSMTGAADFDIVRTQDGRPIVLDAASRFSGSVGVSFEAGVNMPLQLLRFLLNVPLKKEVFSEGTPMRPFITMAPIPVTNEEDLL